MCTFFRDDCGRRLEFSVALSGVVIVGLHAPRPVDRLIWMSIARRSAKRGLELNRAGGAGQGEGYSGNAAKMQGSDCDSGN